MRATPPEPSLPLDLGPDDLVQTLRWCLSCAARGMDPPRSLLRAFEVVLVFAESGQALTVEQRDDLLERIARHRPSIIGQLAKHYGAEQLRIGLKALSGLLMFSADTTVRRMERHPDEISDVRSYAMLVRNDLENMVLMIAVVGRAHRRGESKFAALDAAVERRA